MSDIGEQIVGAYLKLCRGCELVEYDVPLREAVGKGEIDVIGVDLDHKIVYSCEVATHVLGLQYVHNKRPATAQKLKAKFLKNVPYIKEHFRGFKQVHMFWSPVVKVSGEKTKYQAVRDLEDVQKFIHSRYKVQVEMVYNQEYLKRFNELKAAAAHSSERSFSAPVRLLQIQNALEKHCARLESKRKAK